MAKNSSPKGPGTNWVGRLWRVLRGRCPECGGRPVESRRLSKEWWICKANCSRIIPSGRGKGGTEWSG